MYLFQTIPYNLQGEDTHFLPVKRTILYYLVRKKTQSVKIIKSNKDQQQIEFQLRQLMEADIRCFPGDFDQPR